MGVGPLFFMEPKRGGSPEFRQAFEGVTCICTFLLTHYLILLKMEEKEKLCMEKMLGE